VPRGILEERHWGALIWPNRQIMEFCMPCDLRKKVELRDLPMLPSSDAIAAWQVMGWIPCERIRWWEWHGMAQRMPSKSTEWWTFWFLWKVMEGGRSPTEIQQVSTKVAKFCHWMVMMATQTTIRQQLTQVTMRKMNIREAISIVILLSSLSNCVHCE
jgi:hypothetical protein